MGGCLAGLKRMCGGESFFLNTFRNESAGPACVAINPNFPSKVIPIDLSKSGPIHAHPGLYIAHLGDVNITYKFVRNPLAGCFGGSGFLLLKLTGTGTVFMSGGGQIMEKILAPGEVLLADTQAIVAFAGTVEYNVRTVGGCLTCCCGGEGLFNTQLTGPGLVVLQSMSLDKLRKAIGVYTSAAAAGASAGAGAGAAAARGV
jgi:uncharacterized protein (TIGR00266 family)